MSGLENDVSVIVCAYTEDRWELMIRAVASLQQQELPPAEIVLVVDHNPSLLERARREVHGERLALESIDARSEY